MKRIGLVLALCALLTPVLRTQPYYTVETVPNPQTTQPPGFVSDPGNLLANETKLLLNRQIDSLKHRQGTEIAVVALESIGDAEINDFANRLYNHWGIGQKQQSNGLLLLFVTDIREVVIRTGYGVEGVLPDLTASRIISEVIIPEFRTNGYDAGIVAAVERIIRILDGEPFTVEKPRRTNWTETLPYAAAIYLLMMLMGWLWLQSTVKQVMETKKSGSNIDRYISIRDKNRAIYAIIGIVLPAILFVLFLFVFQTPDHYLLLVLFAPVAGLPTFLYGKRIMRKVRRAPIPCTACGTPMQILSEEADNARLMKTQQLEEELKSMDYDVFVCPACDNHAIFALELGSTYTRCPQCKAKTYATVSTKTIVEPTYTRTGTLRTTRKCRNCAHRGESDTVIPRLTRSGAGAAAGSGGGFSSGGFGGGRSGGGGASGRW